MPNATLVLSADVKQAISELQRLNGFVNNWAGQMRGAMLSAFSFYAAYQGIRQTIQSINEFNASISELKALTGLAGTELEKLRQNALNLAGAYRAIDLAKGQSELSRLGFSPDEINKSIKAVALLATATGSDLPKATEIAGSTLRAFGLEASQMQRITDVMASSFNKTALDVTSFGEAMKYVAPNAAAAGISMEETTAMLGTLANNGIKGSMAGTALRRIIQDLAGESGTLSDKFQKLNEKNITASYAFDEVGRIASTAFLILAKGAKTTDELANAFHNVNGETQKMADIMMDNVIGAWKNLNAEWDRVINDNSGPLTSFMQDLLKNMKDQLAVWNSDHVTFLQKLFGDSDDYAEYAKNIAKIREEVTKLNAAVFDMSDQGMDFMIKTDAGGSGDGATGFRGAAKQGFLAAHTKAVIEEVTGLIPTLEKKIEDLGEAMKNTWDPLRIKDYATQIEKIRDILEKIKQPIKEVRDTIHGRLNLGMGRGDALYNNKIPSMADMIAESFGDRGKIEGPDGPGGRPSAKMMKALQASQDAGRVVAQGFMNAFRRVLHGIGDVIATAFMGGNWQAALLDTIGNIAIELGGIIVAIGLGVESIKEALTNPFTAGPAAIAAGVALIGLGAAFKAGAASIAGGGGGGSSGGGVSMPRWADRDMALSGEWRIRGADLVYVLDKQGYRSGVVGG